jgi:GT2 family glycosyltransferase
MNVCATSTVSARTGVADIELTAGIPSLVDVPALGVRCLVRITGRPVGILDLHEPTDRIDPEVLTGAVWAELRPAIVGALLHLGAEAPDHLTSDGLAVPVTPRAPAVDDSITVAIATRDRPETLMRCIRSILSARPAPAAIVIVDNAPSDHRTRDGVAETYGGDPRITYVVEPRPGLGRAHNAALAHIMTPYVALTDDDVVVDSGWIGAIGEAFASGDDVACVSGLILPAELRSPEQWWIECSTGFGKGFRRQVRSLRTRSGEGPLFPYDAGSFGSGANMAFSMAFLEMIGGFDDALGTGTRSMGGDDLAALHRAVASGHDLVYEPAAIVFHRHHDNLPALRRQAYGYGAGLTAYLASLVVARPSEALAIARRAVPGIGRIFHPSSTLNARRHPDYPPSLVWRERAGMAAGPLGYVRQRMRDRADQVVA